jgi:hypothetical protein
MINLHHTTTGIRGQIYFLMSTPENRKGRSCQLSPTETAFILNDSSGSTSRIPPGTSFILKRTTSTAYTFLSSMSIRKNLMESGGEGFWSPPLNRYGNEKPQKRAIISYTAMG